MRIVTAVVLSVCLAATAVAQTPEYNGPLGQPRGTSTTDQIIIKWRKGTQSAAAASSTRAQKLRSFAAAPMRSKYRITTELDVLALERPYAKAELDQLLREVAANPEVEYAVADQRRWAHAVPSDPLYVEQWYFRGTELAGTRAEQAWDTTVGSNTTVVAVLDTGVRYEHPDLGRAEQGGKLLAGFDFISRPEIANDGDGFDADASDPGDWVSAADAQQPPFNGGNCIPQGETKVDSSWHGTRVSSLIAALTNNTGMAGSSWNALILPLRVLGKCGGLDSDIITAMRWAAGLTVPGIANNGTPAQIINLSLGGDGICSFAYQQAVSEITARGVLIVASVGNDGGAIGTPANCPGVLGVTGLRHAGTKVGFSNLGPLAGLGAPAGNCVNTGVGQPCLFSVVVASNSGTTMPQLSIHTDQINFNVGTSFSAPLVAGAAALMHSINAQLAPANYITLLRETAAPFATSSSTTTTVCHVPVGDLQTQECICTTQTCGAGMLNTQAAVLAAQRPFAIADAPVTITPTTTITADGRASFASNGRTITAYQWSALSVVGAAPTFADATQAQTTFQVADSSRFTLQLTVTDDQGGQDTAQIQVATPPPPAPPTPLPPRPSSGGGGGGNVGGLLLALALLRWVSRMVPAVASGRPQAVQARKDGRAARGRPCSAPGSPWCTARRCASLPSSGRWSPSTSRTPA